MGSGTNGFRHIMKCLKETVQATNPGDDSQGGTSGWAVYSRVSSATKKKMRDLIVAQVTRALVPCRCTDEMSSLTNPECTQFSLYSTSLPARCCDIIEVYGPAAPAPAPRRSRI